jgi:mono/diheme cytochrome c family protein
MLLSMRSYGHMKLFNLQSLSVSTVSVAALLQLLVNTGVLAKKPVTPADRIKQGKALYAANECSACHQIQGQGCKNGIRLDNLPPTHNRQFILEQLKDPESHVAKNAAAFGVDSSSMPRPQLTRQESELIADYIHSVQQKKTKRQR